MDLQELTGMIHHQGPCFNAATRTAASLSLILYVGRGHDVASYWFRLAGVTSVVGWLGCVFLEGVKARKLHTAEFVGKQRACEVCWARFLNVDRWF